MQPEMYFSALNTGTTIETAGIFFPLSYTWKPFFGKQQVSYKTGFVYPYVQFSTLSQRNSSFFIFAAAGGLTGVKV
jgi:hypothetical protein